MAQASCLSPTPYEPNRNLITGIENTHGTDLISSFAYTNDELGRRTERVDLRI